MFKIRPNQKSMQFYEGEFDEHNVNNLGLGPNARAEKYKQPVHIGLLSLGLIAPTRFPQFWVGNTCNLLIIDHLNPKIRKIFIYKNKYNI